MTLLSMIFLIFFQNFISSRFVTKNYLKKNQISLEGFKDLQV